MLRDARKTFEVISPGFGLFRTTGKTSMKRFISKEEEPRQTCSLVPSRCLPYCTPLFASPVQPSRSPPLSCALLLTNGLTVRLQHRTGHLHSTCIGATQHCLTDEQVALNDPYCKKGWHAHLCSPGEVIWVILLCYGRWTCYLCTGHRSQCMTGYHRTIGTHSREHPVRSQPTSVSFAHLSLQVSSVCLGLFSVHPFPSDLPAQLIAQSFLKPMLSK